MKGEDEFTPEELAEFERQAIGNPPYVIACEAFWEKAPKGITLKARYSDDRIENLTFPSLDAAGVWAAERCPELRVKFPLPDDGMPF